MRMVSQRTLHSCRLLVRVGAACAGLTHWYTWCPGNTMSIRHTSRQVDDLFFHSQEENNSARWHCPQSAIRVQDSRAFDIMVFRCKGRYGSAARAGHGDMAIQLYTVLRVVVSIKMGLRVTEKIIAALVDLERLADPSFGRVSIIAMDAAGNHP